MDRYRWFLLAAVSCSGIALSFLMTGMREHVFKPLFMILAGYVIAKGRVPWRAFLIIFPVAVLVVTPWLSVYKSLAMVEMPFADRIRVATVFVLPSIEDGFAMVILQAMACGLPVICTTNTGGGDVIRDDCDGYVVPIRDVDALKEKITYLYEHAEERKAMAQMAMKRAQEFSWDVYGDRIVAAYIAAMNKGRLFLSPPLVKKFSCR